MEGGGGAESAGEGYGELVGELVSRDLEGGRQAGREGEGGLPGAHILGEGAWAGGEGRGGLCAGGRELGEVAVLEGGLLVSVSHVAFG